MGAQVLFTFGFISIWDRLRQVTDRCRVGSCVHVLKDAAEGGHGKPQERLDGGRAGRRLGGRGRGRRKKQEEGVEGALWGASSH